MRELILIIGLLIFSCSQEQKIMQIKNQSDFRKFIDKEILWLKELDSENKFNQYYIVEVNDLLYIINTNRGNLYRFMIIYDNISCENIEDERIIFLESITPKYDISSYYTNNEKPCDILVNYNSDPKPPKVNGVILKIDNKSKNIKFDLLKRGDISQDIITNKSFEIKGKPTPEPVRK